MELYYRALRQCEDPVSRALTFAMDKYTMEIEQLREPTVLCSVSLPSTLYHETENTVLSALGYLLYAAIMGGSYIAEFEMDEKGVTHKQIASQTKNAK